MDTNIGSRIQFRRGRAKVWTDANPVLYPGEPGYEIDTKKWKIGDGMTPWRDLPYQAAAPSGIDPSDLPSDSALATHILDPTPHPAYDDGPSFLLLYQNAKV